MKALDSSGILKDIDNVSQDEGKRKVLAELSRQGLGHIHPDIVVCNSSHYFFVVAPEPPPPTEVDPPTPPPPPDPV
jgi:hypothetical protein